LIKQLKIFLWFYALTFLLLAFIPLVDLLLAAGGLNFNEAAERASAETGIEWTSNLLVVFRLSMVEPTLLLVVIGSLVPALAAVIVVKFLDRPRKWREFFGRFNPLCGTKVVSALRLYGLIFVILVPLLVLVLVIRQQTGGNYQMTEKALGLGIIPALLAIAFLDQGALLEELGWRGFAAHELQNGIMTPFKAALLIGVCWGLWHLPRDITTGVIERLGMVQYLLLYLPSFILGTVAISIIAAYFMNRLGGSLIPAIMIHGLTNDAIGLSGTASIVEALTPYHQVTKNLPLAILAILIVMYSGQSLGLKKIQNAGSAAV
jgi:membrane protease YdiL (CAAX protease family)